MAAGILVTVLLALLALLGLLGYLWPGFAPARLLFTLTQGDLFHIATEFKGLASSHLITETLPTKGYTTGGGADVLLAAQPYANKVIAAFNQLGLPKPKPKAPAKVVPTLARSLVSVEVFNASTVSGIAHDTATKLTTAGFTIATIGNAPSQITPGDPSEIWYGPTGLEAAHTLGAALSGATEYVPDPSLTGNTVALLIAGSALTLKSTATTTTTTTTVPGATSGATTTTTIPSNVYTNTQAEPWNPVPCTLGAATQAGGTTVPTAKVKNTSGTKKEG